MLEQDTIGITQETAVQNEKTGFPSQVEVHVLDVDLSHALSVGPQLEPWSIAALKLYLIVSVAFMDCLGYGFDANVVGSVNGLTQYTDYFGLAGGSTGGGKGIITAVLFSIGIALVTAAQNRVYLFCGRFCLGFGAVIIFTSAPAYVAEISPPQACLPAHRAAKTQRQFSGGAV
ncbi:hypothetical protein FB45DRAFT_1023851 [Roridomyces roridus]|uniref:Uncharacterized protein n=1 Tax=Roridomyces roridus TaxID=1738132 RepID=A0AAD7C5D3_9AGAR|nr:hypothetical protein FB45DRAFT_1023851 [Roridomyces roridus]